MRVVVRDNDVSKALRKLKKMMHNEGIIKEVMDKRHFTKPSDAKRLKKKEAKRRQAKEARNRDKKLNG